MAYQKNRIDLLSHVEDSDGFAVTRMVVCGSSMKPFFRAGQMVAVRPVPAEAIRKGSVILFSCGDSDAEDATRVMHRVIDIVAEKGNRRYLCRGDNNFRPDGYIDPDHVIGKVMGRYTKGELKPLRRYHELGGLILAGCYRRFKSVVRERMVAAWPFLSRWFARTITVQDNRGCDRDLVFVGWGYLRFSRDFKGLADKAGKGKRH